jgi:Uma2 family endonuclease
MQVQTEQRYYTPAEYLELEAIAEYRSEYHDGEIVTMTGGTGNHNRIAVNLCKKLPFHIKGQNYEIFINDMRVSIPQYRKYLYPDTIVVEGEPVYEDKVETIITNPLLIFEVLSKSTKNYDQGDKFDFYRSLSSFKEYILIDQYQYYVEQFAKTADNKWELTEYRSATDVLALSSLDFQINFSDIYHRVNFEPSEA